MRLFEYQFQDVDSSKEMQLSVHVSMNGFSFCVSNIYSGKLYYITKYRYENDAPQRIVEEMSRLSGQIKEISILHNSVSVFSPKFILQPFPFTNPIKTALAIDTLYGNADKNQTYCCDPVAQTPLYISWHTSSLLYNTIKQIHPNTEIQCSQSIQIQKYLHLYQPYILTNSLFLHFEEKYFSLTQIQENSIRFCNIYKNEGPECVLYHILSSLPTLQLNPQTAEIIYSGCFDERIIPLLKQYIKKVNPIEMLHLKEQLQNRISNHFIQENFNILSLHKCE